MFGRIIRAYRQLRYLPRHIVTVLDRAAADIEAARLRQNAFDARMQDSWLRISAELNAFRGETLQQLLHSRNALDVLGTRIAALETMPSASADMLAVVGSVRTELARIASRQVSGDAASQTGIAALSGLISQQIAWTENFAAVMAAHVQLYPSRVWTPESAGRIRAILGLLCPVAVLGVAKTRVGRDRDGGYVMLDDFDGIGAALSLGIADDVSWDAGIARRGIRVLQFDPSVGAPPHANDLFEFEPLRVAAHDGGKDVSLDSIVQTRIGSHMTPLLMKMDIEGDEWDVLEAASDATLLRFRQIVCEFHHLERLGEASFAARAQSVFDRLARSHFVHHVHGNNCGSFINVGNVIVPQTLEVSYGIRAAYATCDEAMVFPTKLDRPNEPGRADLYLGSFRFATDET